MLNVRTITDIVNEAAPAARFPAIIMLIERDHAIADNIREVARSHGLNNASIDIILNDVGLLWQPAVDPAIEDILARISSAEAQLVQARAELAAVRR